MKLIFYFFILCSVSSAGAYVPPPKADIKKPIIKEPEIKPYAVPSLKLLSFDSGLKKFGRDFIEEFEQRSTIKLTAYEDLKADSREYYNLCCREIDQMLKKQYPQQLWHAPPAQPLEVLVDLVMKIHKKSRFELLAIINQRYYAELEWPAITLFARVSDENNDEKNLKEYYRALKILLDAGADIDACDRLRYSAISRAAKSGNLEAVKLLIERGASLTIVDHCKKTAAQHAEDGIKRERSIGNAAKEQRYQAIFNLITAKLEEIKPISLRNSQNIKQPKANS